MCRGFYVEQDEANLKPDPVQNLLGKHRDSNLRLIPSVMFLDPPLTQVPQEASFVLNVSEMYTVGTSSGGWPMHSALRQVVWHKLSLEI